MNNLEKLERAIELYCECEDKTLRAAFLDAVTWGSSRHLEAMDAATYLEAFAQEGALSDEEFESGIEARLRFVRVGNATCAALKADRAEREASKAAG